MAQYIAYKITDDLYQVIQKSNMYTDDSVEYEKHVIRAGDKEFITKAGYRALFKRGSWGSSNNFTLIDFFEQTADEAAAQYEQQEFLSEKEYANTMAQAALDFAETLGDDLSVSFRVEGSYPHNNYVHVTRPLTPVITDNLYAQEAVYENTVARCKIPKFDKYDNVFENVEEKCAKVEAIKQEMINMISPQEVSE